MTEVLVVGQGIAGVAVAHHLRKRNCHVTTIDDSLPSSASRVAAGMINPVTGRSYVKSWMVDELIAKAKTFYTEIESLLNLDGIIKSTSVIRTLPDQAAENKWYHRLDDSAYQEYLEPPSDLKQYAEVIHPVFSAGTIHEAYQINLGKTVDAYKLKYADDNISTILKYDEIKVGPNSIEYMGRSYDLVVFAEGYRCVDNPFFNHLPFQPAKGEVLLIRIPGFKTDLVLRHKLFLIPLEDDIFWVGAGYNWNINQIEPSEEEGNRLRSVLDEILKVPYEVIDHIAGVRPATKGRRPFLGRHPDHPRLAIFNGMGTKGASLSPYWADHFVQHLLDGIELHPEVDIARF